MTVRNQTRENVIDLDGPAGNAFALLGNARVLAKQLMWSKEEIDNLLDEMMGGDYLNLVKTFDDAFGDYVVLETNQEYLLEALAD